VFGASDETKDARPSGYGLGGPLASSEFYPRGLAPAPRPTLQPGDECFVRDGNDCWRPGVVNSQGLGLEVFFE
jgi:hypothetical protein